MLDSDDPNWLRPIPIFPLPNCVLFPGAVQPLHIFEPRYVAMLQAITARESPARLMAMALLREGWEPHYHSRRAPLHPMLCVGRVIQHEQLPDGCFNLLLLGLRRAAIVVETGDEMYRQALLAPVSPGAGSPDDAGLRDLLHRTVTAFSRQNHVLTSEAVERIFETAPTTDLLVDVLAYHLVPAERTAFRQSLLEECRTETRAVKLLRHLRAMLNEQVAPASALWPPSVNLN